MCLYCVGDPIRYPILEALPWAFYFCSNANGVYVSSADLVCVVNLRRVCAFTCCEVVCRCKESVHGYAF